MHVIRLDYHTPDNGALMLGAVRPLMHAFRASAQVRKVLVWTHWLRGPHIGIAVDTDESYFADVCYPLALSQLGSWLTAAPSVVHLDPAEYERSSAQLASAENETRARLPLAADNVVSRGFYDRPAPMNMPELGDIRDQFQADIVELAFDMIDLKRRSRAGFMVKVACMIACLGSVLDDERFAFWPTSVLGHSLGFRAARPEAQQLMEQTATRLSGPIETELRRYALVGARYGEGESSPILDAWMKALVALEQHLQPVVSVHRERIAGFDLYGQTGAATAARSYQDVTLTDPSMAPLRDAIVRTTLHLRFRIMINFIYGVLPLLGISPTERACLCHCLYRVLADSFETQWAQAQRNVRALGERALAEDVA